jgi:hypothetical protein
MEQNSNCETCYHFDGSNHKNDRRTAHAGICKKWCEVMLRTETCKAYFAEGNLPDWDAVTAPAIDSVAEQPTSNQLNLFI